MLILIMIIEWADLGKRSKASFFPLQTILTANYPHITHSLT